MDEGLKQDIITASKARGQFCAFLASVYFTELTPDQIETFAHMGFEDDGSQIARGYAVIHEYLRHRDSATRQELAVDYAHTFLDAGSYKKVLAPPYESVFTSKGQLLMQDARDKALVYYRSEHVGLPEGNTTPEDHLSFELQFQAKLIDRSVAALEEGAEERFRELLEKQRSFFAYHQENWLPAFCDAVDENAQTDFYRGIAQLTRGYLEEEQQFFAVVAGELGMEDAPQELRPEWLQGVSDEEASNEDGSVNTL